MKNKNIDEILNGLQDQKPVLFNEDELTDMIMDNLPDIQLDAIDEKEKPASTNINTVEQTKEKPQQAPPRILVFIRTISSVAAVWLIGLFAYTYSDMTGLSDENVTISHCQVSTSDYSFSNSLKNIYANRLEKKKTISVYKQIIELQKSNWSK